MEYLIIALISYLAGIFTRVYTAWFSYKLDINKHKIEIKISLLKKFIQTGANIVAKTTLETLKTNIKSEAEATALQYELILKLDYLEEFKIFNSNNVYKKVLEFKKAVKEFYDMEITLTMLTEQEKVRNIDAICFLNSISNKKNFKNILNEIKKDSEVAPEFLKFLEKYYNKENLFHKVTTKYEEALSEIQKEIC
jgi:hypothetical protein